MDDPDKPDLLAAVTTIAAKLRDGAASIADKANEAAGAAPSTDSAGGESGSDPWSSADFGAIAALLAQLGSQVSNELRERLSGSVDDLLITTREMIDWYLSRDNDSGEQPPSA